MKNTVSAAASLLCFLFCAARCIGQTFDVKYSDPISDLTRNYILPVDGGGFIGMKKEDKTGYGSWNKYRRIFTFTQYDKAMKPVKEMHPADKGFVFTVFFSDFKKIGNKYWLFYIEPAEKKTIGDLKAVEITPATLELGTPKTITESSIINLNVKFFFGLTSLWAKLKSSPDGNRTGFAMSTGKSDFFVTCLDENLDALWSRNETNPLASEMQVDDFETDNAGNVYVGCTAEEKGYVGIYGKTEKTWLPIETGGTNRLYGLSLLTLRSVPKVAVAGMYYEGTKNLTGVYKTSIDVSTHSLSETTRTPYPKDIVALFDKDGFGNTKESKYGLEPGFLSQLVETKEGIALVAEKKQLMATPRFEVLHSGSILTVYYTAQSVSFNRLPKYNVSAGTYWKHFYACPAGKSLVVFYNDNPVNLSKNITESPKLVDIEDNSVLVAAVITPAGVVKRELPISTGEKYTGVAEYVQPLLEDTLAVPLFQKKKKNLYAVIAIH